MPAGLALLMFAQAATVPASSGPPAPAPPKKPVVLAPERCPTTRPGADSRDIIICAQKPDGYRIDPDLLEARREKKKNGNRPKPPDRMVDRSCAVGPMGCGPQAGINLVAAAITAATMVKKAVDGGNVGQMFITDPQPSEYQLYLEAKARREAREAEEKAAAVAAKARADAAAQEAAKASSK